MKVDSNEKVYQFVKHYESEPAASVASLFIWKIGDALRDAKVVKVTVSLSRWQGQQWAILSLPGRKKKTTVAT